MTLYTAISAVCFPRGGGDLACDPSRCCRTKMQEFEETRTLDAPPPARNPKTADGNRLIASVRVVKSSPYDRGGGEIMRWRCHVELRVVKI